MPTKKERGTINTMPKKPSPYGDRIAEAVMFLIGVAVFIFLVLHR